MDFEKLIRPDSIAVIGASANPLKVGSAILNNILTDGYKGAIYPVNPKEKEIFGRKCYNSLQEIPDPIDCAVIVIKR